MTSRSILADAAHTIAARYSSSDPVPGASTNDIDTAFVAATGQDAPAADDTARISPMKRREYDVPTLAAMLADDYADAWDQVLGCQVVSETIDASRQWPAKARAQLAEAWPPEHSPAALGFLTSPI